MRERAKHKVPLPREIYVLVGASFVIAVGYGLVAPVLPAFAASFGVGITAASAVVSAFALARLIFAPMGGSLASRFGNRKVYLAGLLIVALSSAASAFATTYLQLLVMRGLGGIGSTMFTISALGLMVRLAPLGARGRASGLFGSAFLVGGVAGPSLGALAAGLGLRAPFILYALFLLVATVIVARMLPASVDDLDAPPPVAAASEAQAEAQHTPQHSPEHKPEDSAESLPEHALGKPAVPADAAPMTTRQALNDSAFRAALLTNFVHGWVNMGVRMAAVPLLAGVVALAETGDERAAQQFPGLAVTAFALGNIIAVLYVGSATDRLGRRPFLRLGLFAGAAFTAIFGFSDTRLMMVVLGVLAGLGAGAVAAPMQAVVADVTAARGKKQSTALATFQMTGDAGAILGPIVVGMVADGFGYGPAFMLSGGLLAVAGIAWLFARESLQRQDGA